MPIALSIRALALAGTLMACTDTDETADSAQELAERVVVTPQGRLVGTVEGTTGVYKGIRYALAERWQPPVASAPSSATIAVQAFGAPCMQVQSGPGGAPMVTGAEDCLFVNVWEPIFRWPGERLPVYVFIHGGAFLAGSASDAGLGGSPLYDGRALSERERVVVVTFNYRLNIAGFFSHAALGAADPAAGSYGLLDQIAALRWVHATIGAFGGDPARVTVAGESAGSVSVCNLLVSPVAGPLLAGAVMESGPCNAGTRPRRDAFGASLAAAAGCGAASDPVACLRTRPLDQLLRQLTFGGGTVDGDELMMGPIAGTPALPESPWQLLKTGRHRRVPVLLGSNQWEVPPLVVSVDAIVERARQFGLEVTPEEVEDVADAFRAVRPELSRESALAAVATDAVFTCPTHRIAGTLAAEGTQRVFRYRFDHGPSVLGIEVPAIHGMELLYAFGSYRGLPPFSLGPVDDHVAGQLQDALGSFARSGEPPWWHFWGAFDPRTDNAYLFDGWASWQRSGIGAAECAILAPWLDEIMPR